MKKNEKREPEKKHDESEIYKTKKKKKGESNLLIVYTVLRVNHGKGRLLV